MLRSINKSGFDLAASLSHSRASRDSANNKAVTRTHLPMKGQQRGRVGCSSAPRVSLVVALRRCIAQEDEIYK